MQGKVFMLPERLFAAITSDSSHAFSALEYVLATPNCTAAICGMRRGEHLEENIRALQSRALDEDAWRDATKSLGITVKQKTLDTK